MYRALASLVPCDPDLPERAHTIDVLTRFLDDEIYDLQPFEFHQERNDVGLLGEYVPIAQRAPCVRSGILATVVNDSVSFLFADGRFPAVNAESEEGKAAKKAFAAKPKPAKPPRNKTDGSKPAGAPEPPKAPEDTIGKEATETLHAIIKDAKINQLMLDAARRGSVGSVCIWLRVLKARLFFEALNTKFLTPTFQADAPDTLEKVREEYKTTGKELRDRGYAIPDDKLGVKYWFAREWDNQNETWFKPIEVEGDKRPTAKDSARSVRHALGFVPMIWACNLPGGDNVDGLCSFKPAIETVVDIDYQLSQASRGLKYSSSPTLVIKTDGMGPQNKAVGDTLLVPTDGDATLLEIDGGAAKAALEFAEGCRRIALESTGGSRADPQKLSAATSGRAMEMMNQSLIWLADKLRISYGEGALLKLLKMIAEVSRQVTLKDSDGAPVGKIPDGVKLSLVWPEWYAPTSDDRQADATALTTLTAGSILSKRTAVAAIASEYDIENVDDEMNAIGEDADEMQANEVELAKAAPPDAKPPAK